MNKYILSFFLSFCFLLNSALPVTHVYFTKMYFKYYPKYSAEEQKLFLIGTVFPDIRYMGDCDRGDTHWDTISLKEVLEETDPFIAGMKFHSLRGELDSFFVVSVNANWRIIFKFDGEDAILVDYLDYH